MATLYLVIHLFGLTLGFPVGSYTKDDCAHTAEAAPFVLVCVTE